MALPNGVYDSINRNCYSDLKRLITTLYRVRQCIRTAYTCQGVFKNIFLFLVESAPGVFVAYVDVEYRMTFERPSDTFVMRNVDNHDECLRNP